MANGDKRSNGKVVLMCLGLIGGMAGLTAASVPLYDLFCRVTGYGGTPRTATDETAPIRHVESGQVVTIRFNADTMEDLPWRFKADRTTVPVRLGERKLAFYTAENTSEQTITGTAVFNVTPAKAGVYFSKIECFCFTEQTLKPGERMDMPVSFVVDPAMADDEDTAEVRTITLSYTFYPARDQDGDQQAVLEGDKNKTGES